MTAVRTAVHAGPARRPDLEALLAEAGHEVVPDDLADLLVTDRPEPIDATRPGAADRPRWLIVGDEHATAADFDGYAALLVDDPTRRGHLDVLGHDVARRTAAIDVETIQRLTARQFPSPRAGFEQRPLRVVAASHDFVFLGGILDHLRRRTDMDVRIDHVKVFARHHIEASKELAEWADVVLCEWLSPVAAWYSHNRPDDTRLVVRLHRMELFNGWTDAVDIARIERVICVSPHYARLATERTGWPSAKIMCIPNYVDADHFDRPKIVGAQHNLGFVGMVPSRKRLDLALDVVERLRRRDPRYRLFVKTKMPWEYPWNWREPTERIVTADLLERIARTPALRNGVVFEPHGSDVAAWMRKIGYVLSTSDDESFHLSPAEGMASGAVPVVRDWDGSDTIYDRRWVHDSVDAMVDTIHTCTTSGAWTETGRFAQRQVRASFDIDAVCAAFVNLLHGDAPAPVPTTLMRP